MDLNLQLARHQTALMRADAADSDAQRVGHLASAADIAGRIGAFQHGLGAAAACAWSSVHAAGRGMDGTAPKVRI